MDTSMSFDEMTTPGGNNNQLKAEPSHNDEENGQNPSANQETELTPQELPFYLMRAPPPEEVVNGSTNLILHNERQHAFKQYCLKKVKEPLSAFVPDFPGNIDTTSFFTTGDEAKETSTLNSLIDPNLYVVKKEIYALNSQQVQSFRLYTGPPLPEKYMVMVQSTLSNTDNALSMSKKSKKSKKSNEGESGGGGSGEKKKKKKEKKKKKDKDKKDKEKKSSSNA